MMTMMKNSAIIRNVITIIIRCIAYESTTWFINILTYLFLLFWPPQTAAARNAPGFRCVMCASVSTQVRERVIKVAAAAAALSHVSTM